VEPYYVTAGPDSALWFTSDSYNSIGRIATSGVATNYPVGGDLPAGITTGPDGYLWTVAANEILRTPACGLGFSASFSSGTLTMNYSLGINMPANFSIILKHGGVTFAMPFSQNIPAIVPPQAFTMTWDSVPDLGEATVEPILSTQPGGAELALCTEWTAVNTAP
jgi:hypothetical protein